MPISKSQREQLLALCGQLHEDDAVDPRKYFRKKNRRQNSSALRLCKQVAETLSLVLSGEFADDVLHSLDVYAVQPAPHTRRLLVIVKPCDDICSVVTPELILQKLAAVQCVLRQRIAASIARRKTPTLVFQILWPRSGEERG